MTAIGGPHKSADEPHLCAPLRDWALYGPLGGTVRPLARDGGVSLGTVLTALPDGQESWEGMLVGNMIEVIPGRRYRYCVEVRGIGRLTFGLLEYGWKYGASALHEVTRKIRLSSERTRHTLRYTPSEDRVTHVRPFVRVTGWWRRSEIYSAELRLVKSRGHIALQTDHFMAQRGGNIGVTVASGRYPVKLLLYGAPGISGPGGETSGAEAFTLQVKGRAGRAVAASIPIPRDAHEGSYRLVAVEPAGGATATVRFTVRPVAGAAKGIRLTKAARIEAGSRLLFLGDSLTANFPGRNYPALLERALAWRYGNTVEVINAGVGGSNILQIAARLDADVLARDPTHVFLFEGGNDCKRPYRPATRDLGEWVVPPALYERAYREVVSRLAARGIRVTVMTCAPGDQRIIGFFTAQKKLFAEAGNVFCRPADVKRCVAIQKRIAAEFWADVLDTHRLLGECLARQRKTGRGGYLHVDDGVHLSEYGSREVAWLVLSHLSL
jgi:lysophospholipase L1-like esterase